MNNFKWVWCWECDSPTVDMNEGKANMCCARFDIPWEDEKEARDWMKNNQPPDSPTPEEIDKKLNLSRYTKEDILICHIFEAFTYGKFYWHPKKWADKIGHTIPSYKELCEKYGFEPEYDCLTGKEWTDREHKNVHGMLGWDSIESFLNEEIPWSEFCRRMRISKIKAGIKPYHEEEE